VPQLSATVHEFISQKDTIAHAKEMSKAIAGPNVYRFSLWLGKTCVADWRVDQKPTVIDCPH
jgi:hypothetical protein